MSERFIDFLTSGPIRKVYADYGWIANNLHQKFGFKPEGLSKDSFFGSDGKYHDIIHMGLILD